MDIVDASLGLAGLAFHLVMFSIEFVSDAKQVHRKGAPNRIIDLDAVATNIQSSTDSLESQLGVVKSREENGEVEFDPEAKVCIKIFSLLCHWGTPIGFN